MRQLTIIVLLSLVGVGCSGADSSTDTTVVVPTTSAVTTTSSTAVPETMNRQAFQSAIDRIGEFSEAWATAGLTWLSAYSDDSVPIDDYLAISHETELQYRRLIGDLVYDSGRFPTVMQDATGILIENYQGRVDAFHRIIQAEVAADNDAWNDAFDEYYSYSNPETNHELLQEMLSSPVVEATLAEMGVSIEDVLKSLAAAAGVEQ